MAIEQINNGTHGRYRVPVGLVLNLAPLGQSSLARATSSVSGLGSWGPTSSPISIGPFQVETEITVEVMQGLALVDVLFPSASAPVTISGTPGAGNTLAAALATGWSVTGYQWMRDGSAISGATASTYVQQVADQGHIVTLSVSGLAYTSNGVTVPGGGGGGTHLWDDTQFWTDTSTWQD